MWIATKQSKMKKKMESICKVHEPWMNMDSESNSWNPPCRNQYDGLNREGVRGPLSYITKIMYRKSVSQLFLVLFPLTSFKQIVNHTNFYEYEENVKQVDATDRDVNMKKKKQFVSHEKRDLIKRTCAPNRNFSLNQKATEIIIKIY